MASDEELVRALKRTWNVIAEDSLALGPPMNGIEVAGVTADYVYRDGHDDPVEAKRLSAALMALDEKEFNRIAKLAFPAKRYSA